MAYIRPDGVIVMSDGQLIYGDDPIPISSLCELSQLLCSRPVVSGGAFPLGGSISRRRGDAGFQGPIGFQSEVTVEGVQGNQGFQGAQGARGSQGFQGFGAQGQQGFQGAQGSQGFQGPQGFSGLSGNQGFQGSQGSQGFQGPQGFLGSQGFFGLQGFQGAQGFQGFQGVGFQGARGFQGANTVFRFAAGSVVVAAASTVTVYTATRGVSEKLAPAMMVTENVSGAKFMHDAAAVGADSCAGYFDRTASAGEYRFKIENSNAVSARTVNWAVLATRA